MPHLFNPLPQIFETGLADVAEPLTKQEIAGFGILSSSSASAFANDAQGSIYICGKSTSSLDVAWHLEKQGQLKPWDSVLCLAQSSGRGQLRRHWHSPEGNIYAALKLPNSLQGDSASLLVAFLVVKAMQNILEKNKINPEMQDSNRNFSNFSSLIKFKWPNDVLWGEYKIGGILLEEKNSNLLAGIGLNLIFAPPVSALREDSALPAGSIAELGHSFIKNPSFSPFSMWQSLVSMMRFWYESEVLPVKAKNHMQLIEPELAWKGCLVRVCDYFTQEKMPVKTGRVLGLGSQGELCLLIEGREELIVSGSICLA